MNIKRYALALAAVLIMGLTACGEPAVIGDKGYRGTSEEGSRNYDEAMQMYEKNYNFLILNEIPYDEVVVSCKGNVFDVQVTIDGADHITNLGNYILYAIDAFKFLVDEEQQGNVVVRLLYEGDVYMSYSGAVNGSTFGTIYDYRSGSKVVKPLSTVDNLKDMFPLASLYEADKEQYLLSIKAECINESSTK